MKNQPFFLVVSGSHMAHFKRACELGFIFMPVKNSLGYAQRAIQMDEISKIEHFFNRRCYIIIFWKLKKTLIRFVRWRFKLKENARKKFFFRKFFELRSVKKCPKWPFSSRRYPSKLSSAWPGWVKKNLRHALLDLGFIYL